jgi:hypothetical protein
VGERLERRARRPLDQGRGVEPRRIQRLQQIVTGGGDEAGAVGAGGLRLFAGAQQLDLQPLELGALLGELGDGIGRECFR